MSLERPAGLLAGLTYRRGVITRQISAENPTGGRGRGALAVPDAADPQLPHSRMAAQLGQGFKVRPFLSVPADEAVLLADIAGSGVITHIWLSSNVADLTSLRLTMTWDNAPVPAVDVGVADFFCLGGAGRAHTVTSVPIVVGPTRGCTSLWQLPFRDGARIELENRGDVAVDVVAYAVTYEEHPADEVPESRFHARTAVGSPDGRTSEFDIARLAGAGLYVGTAINWTARRPRWWGEGEVKFYLGTDEFPTLVYTGTEDYFGGAWGFGRDTTYLPGGPHGERTFSGPHAGVPYLDSNEGYPREIVLYRWHLQDPIGFDDGLRASVQALGQGPDGSYEVRTDDVLSATAYWYADQTTQEGPVSNLR